MRVVFMGTPDFAVGALEAIVKAGHEVVSVVTQPDKPKGRGKELQCSAVKECALRLGLPVFQPRRIKEQEAVASLREYQADIFVVAAFGQILSKEILEMPKFGCVNIHASLLPKYRGAAPIQWSIIDGEAETGITIMQMDEGLDTGDILFQTIVPIDEKETGASLFDKMMIAGADAIVDALVKIEKGEVTPIKQEESKSCYAKMLSKVLGYIDWNQNAVLIERLIRGLNSWPSAYSYWNNKTLKIWESEVTEEKSTAQAGTVSFVSKDYFCVNTKDVQLKILSVQLEGKKRMAVKDFLLGNNIVVGDKLGKELS